MKRNLRSTLSRVVVAIAAIVALQVGLWLAVGIWTLPSCVPDMIIRDQLEAERTLTQRREHAPADSEAHTYVTMCRKLASRFDPDDLTVLQESLAAYNVHLLTEDQAGAILRSNPAAEPEVETVCYYSDWNSPLVAYVEYGKRDCPLCSWGTGHRAWFVLGFWFPTDAVTYWVS